MTGPSDLKRTKENENQLHNGLWVNLPRVSIPDKPGCGKGGECVVSEEELRIVELCCPSHLCCLNPVDFILINYSRQHMRPCSGQFVNLHLFDGGLHTCLDGCLKSLMSTGDNGCRLSTYTHPGVVRSDVIKVPSHLVLLLVQIV